MSDEIKLTPHPTQRVIREVREYVVDNVGKISVMIALDSDIAKLVGQPEVIFQGYAIIGAQVGPEIRQFPVEFTIPDATSIENAFEKFQECAVAQFRAGMEEARRQAESERNKIITAPAGAVEALNQMKIR